MSAFRFFDVNPRVYFWTFTFIDVRNDDWYMYQWANFLTLINNRFGQCFTGLRVVEAGEGGHGLHFHALVNRRFAIHIIRRLAKRFGMGRITVTKADEGAAWYLSKYMSKDALPLADGIRRWSAFGGFHPTRVRDVKCRSQLSRNIRWVQKHAKVTQISYTGFLFISRQTVLFGPVRSWPVQQVKCVSSQRAIEQEKWTPKKYKPKACQPF